MKPRISISKLSATLRTTPAQIFRAIPRKHWTKDGTIALSVALEKTVEATEFISAPRLGSLCGLSSRRVLQLAEEGTIPRNADGRMQRGPALAAMFGLFKERCGESVSPLCASKAEARELELKLLRLRVEAAEARLISREDAARVWDFIRKSAVEKFAPIAKELAPRLMSLTSESALELEVQNKVNACLEALSRQKADSSEELFTSHETNDRKTQNTEQ
jgi:hypothetical protein